jgi:NAD+ diphosphatase
MALVKKENKILLARSPHFPEKLYSVLAGFVDPGETLEQCVIREVLEEVGIQVKNLQYFGSQPWPLSHSLMIGFVCEWASGEIQTDPLEIEDAGWFDMAHLPQIPTNISLARALIDSAFF